MRSNPTPSDNPIPRPSRWRVGLALAAGVALWPAAAPAGAGWTGTGVVLELRATVHGRFLVRIDVPDNPSGCRNEEWFYRDLGAPGARQIFDVLRDALAGASPARVYVTGRCDLEGFSEISAASVGRPH